MSIASLLAYLFSGVAVTVSLAAAILGLLNATRHPEHALSKTSAVMLAKAGFGCLFGAGVLHLMTFVIGLFMRFAPSGRYLAVGGMGLIGELAAVAGAAGLGFLAFSVGEFVKLGTADKT